MEFQTIIFEENKKKARENRHYNYMVAGIIIVIILLFLFAPKGFGIGSLILSVAGLIKMKKEDQSKKGHKAFGRDRASLVIAEDYFIIRSTKIPFGELNELIIYVDEYTGMTKDVFWEHHGGNNEIRFTHKGKTTSFNYLIKSQEEYQYVEKLVDRIEAKYPNKQPSV